MGSNVMSVTYGCEDGNTIHEGSREIPSGIDAFCGVVSATDVAYDLSISTIAIFGILLNYSDKISLFYFKFNLITFQAMKNGCSLGRFSFWEFLFLPDADIARGFCRRPGAICRSAGRSSDELCSREGRRSASASRALPATVAGSISTPTP
jgi:hypothetical protein